MQKWQFEESFTGSSKSLGYYIVSMKNPNYLSENWVFAR
jgi:hypothetical protein